MEEDRAQSGWLNLVDIGTKAAIFAYGIGYLIETIYDSVFGVYDFEFVRTRALFTGCSFVLFAIFVHLTIRVGAAISPVSMPWRQLADRLKKNERVPASIVACIQGAAALSILVELTQLSQIVFVVILIPLDRFVYFHFDNNRQWSELLHDRHFFVLLVIQFACMSMLFIAWQFIAERMPLLAVAVVAFFSIGFIVVTHYIGDLSAGLILWLCAVLISKQVIDGFLKDKRSDTRRLLALASCLCSIVIYARMVYPNMLPWLGGPPKATIQITCNNKCSVDGKQMRLIEETSDGYFLVPFNGSTIDSTFVPRANIKEVIFMSSPKFLMK